MVAACGSLPYDACETGGVPRAGRSRALSSGAATGTEAGGAVLAPEPVLPRVAAGESGATRECLKRYGGLVWSLCRRMCATEAEAEDAVQDIFLDVWQSAHRYDASIASETAFVAMITRRRLIDRRRKAGRRPKEQGLADGGYAQGAQSRSGVGPDASDTAPETKPAVLDEAARASEALAKLSEAQQRVIRLGVYHGLSHEKIAQATGMPLGTVKTHSRRGLIRLRELLAAQDGPGAGAGAGAGGDS